MGTLTALVDGLASGAIEVVDLTAPLSADTPIIQLPPEFGQTERFALEEISRYDDRGPAWYWNNFRSGEHTGTHFDAPNHWVTARTATTWRPCRAPADRARRSCWTSLPQAADDADFLLEVDDIKGWEQRARTRCRTAAGCSIARAGTPGPPSRRRSSTLTRPARTRRGCPPSAPAGSPRSHR